MPRLKVKVLLNSADAKPWDLKASENGFDRTKVGRLGHADKP